MKPAQLLFLLLVLRAAASAAVPIAGGVPSDHAARMTRGLVEFQTHVRPLLSEHCVQCHGGQKTKGGLDLTTREGLLQGGTEGPVIQPFAAANSRLLRLVGHREEPHMPSKSDKLPDSAIAHLASWIDDGAPYDRPLVDRKAITGKDRSSITDSDRKWWAFQPLRGGVGKGQSIDSLVRAQFAEQKRKLQPRADRRTLIRRASFDLLGLPPTPEEVEAFQRDDSPDAWARLVARLLDSPRYGERWARHWLDVARFAESSGFEHDYDRPGAYHYRDFVIKALNMDMPYDQFVRWQIAGDEFEPDNPLALMATGFLGAGVFPTQITANEVERTRYDAMDDMLSTTGTAMLGLTIGCARCHDHKFDPIPTRDYYRMLATFTTTVRSDVELDLQPEANRTAKETFDRAHIPLVKSLETYEQGGLKVKFDAWLAAGAMQSMTPAWEVLEPSVIKSKVGATFKKLDDGSFRVEGSNGDSDVYTFVAGTKAKGLRALRIEALSDSGMKKGGPGRADNGNIGLSRIRVFASALAGGPTNEIKLINPRATFEQNSGNLSVASALDDNPQTGWAVDPKFGTNHAAVFEFEQPLTHDAGVRLEVRLEFALNTRHNIGRPRLAVTTRVNPKIDDEGIPANIAAILESFRGRSSVAGTLEGEDRGALLNWWKTSDSEWRSLQGEVEKHARLRPKPKLAKVLICGEGYPAVRMHTQGADFFLETFQLSRGSTDQKRGVASPGYLQVLRPGESTEMRWKWKPQEGAKFSGRRRSMANWMTDPEVGAGHLLARVIVNRLWQHHFGQGLVSTPNDFGAQGSKPANPELLDWLASELIRNGWRLKPLHHLILTSSVYQQRIPSKGDEMHLGSVASVQKRAAKSGARDVSVDAFVPIPRRLSAEAIRDSLLFVSGVLETNMYGPGTLDEASRRRSIYFTIKRSQLVGAMQAFDAPEPLVSQGVRPNTTVAPQALFLMNSPHVRNWAAAFAKRIQPREEQPIYEAVVRVYAHALNRKPTKREQADAVTFLEQQVARHGGVQKPDSILLALTDFAQVVLGLNEFIYVD